MKHTALLFLICAETETIGLKALVKKAKPAVLLLAISLLIACKENEQDRIVHRIVAHFRDSQTAYQNVFLVGSTRQYDWNKESREWVPTRAGDHTRIWIESLNAGRWRIDHDPEICKWSGGAAPFSEDRYLEAFDGRNFLKIDHVYDNASRTYGSRISEKRWGRESKRLQWCTALMKTLPTAQGIQELRNFLLDVTLVQELRNFFRHSPTSQRKVIEIVDQGRRLLQIEAATVWNNRVVQNQRLVFDPSRSDALVSSELSFPDSNGQLAVRLRWEVTDWRQLAPTVWIPTKWTSEMTPAFGNPEPVRLTYQTERVAHFSANDAAVIFSAADVTINKSVAYPSQDSSRPLNPRLYPR